VRDAVRGHYWDRTSGLCRVKDFGNPVAPWQTRVAAAKDHVLEGLGSQ